MRARVKRCGKSAPRAPETERGKANPVRSKAKQGRCAARAMLRVGRTRAPETALPDEWPPTTESGLQAGLPLFSDRATIANRKPQQPTMPHSLWILLAVILFTAMGVCVKIAGDYFSTMEMVFYRCAVGLPLLLLAARLTKTRLRTSHFKAHCWRAASGFVSLFLFFYALPLLDLATATALLQTSPLFFIAFTAMFMREKISPPMLFALFAAFCGMLLALQPLLDGEWRGGLAAAAAGMGAGAAYFNIRRLGVLREGGIRTVFYFTLISALLSGAWLLFSGGFSASPGAGGAPFALMTGLTACGGQLALTRGLHYGKPANVSVLMYSGIVFSGIAEYAIWQNAPNAAGFAGIALIIGGGVFALARRER